MAQNKVSCRHCGQVYWDSDAHTCPPTVVLVPGSPADIAFRKKRTWAIVGAVLVVLFIIGSLMPDPEPPPPSPRQAAQVAVDPNDPRGPKPVPSEWDGLCPEVGDYLRANLNDPGSLKIVSCYELVSSTRGWIQRVKYRAKNAFGALVLQDQTFLIYNGRVIEVNDLGG